MIMWRRPVSIAIGRRWSRKVARAIIRRLGAINWRLGGAMIAIVGGGLFVVVAPILVLVEAASCDDTDQEEDQQDRPPHHLLGPA